MVHNNLQVTARVAGSILLKAEPRRYNQVHEFPRKPRSGVLLDAEKSLTPGAFEKPALIGSVLRGSIVRSINKALLSTGDNAVMRYLSDEGSLAVLSTAVKLGPRCTATKSTTPSWEALRRMFTDLGARRRMSSICPRRYELLSSWNNGMALPGSHDVASHEHVL
jgi:hypothetical protein